MKFLTNKYSPAELLGLFLVSVFPQHTWTIYMVFRDMPWLVENYYLTQAIGVMGYALLFALGESLILFLILLIFALLLPRQWETAKRLSLVYIAAYILIFWAMASQFYALFNSQIPGFYSALLIGSSHPLWVLYGTSLVLIGISLIPLILWLRNPNFQTKTVNLMERISILSWLYLLLDLAGIGTIILRNIF